jgi:hypothetical protein
MGAAPEGCGHRCHSPPPSDTPLPGRDPPQYPFMLILAFTLEYLSEADISGSRTEMAKVVPVRGIYPTPSCTDIADQ